MSCGGCAMAEPILSVECAAQAILGAHPSTHAVDLEFEECAVHARSNRPDVIERLRDYYDGFVVWTPGRTVTISVIEAPPPVLECTFRPQPPGPGKTRLKEELCDLRDGRIVRKVRTGMVFICGGETHVAVGPCAANLNQVINFINHHHLMWSMDRKRLLLHAAGVCDRRGGLALAGLSGAGKSTLALHLASRGLDFVSNDRLMVARDGVALSMHGLAKMPRVNPGTILHNPNLASLIPESKRNKLRGMPEDELWRLEDKFDVPIGRVYGPERFVLRSHLRGIVVLTWKRTARETVVRQSTLQERLDLLPMIMKSPGPFCPRPGSVDTGAHTAQDYLELLGDCPVLEIAGGVSFPDATDRCQAFLERCEGTGGEL
jgi:HprK-related kinase B